MWGRAGPMFKQVSWWLYFYLFFMSWRGTILKSGTVIYLNIMNVQAAYKWITYWIELNLLCSRYMYTARLTKLVLKLRLSKSMIFTVMIYLSDLSNLIPCSARFKSILKFKYSATYLWPFVYDDHNSCLPWNGISHWKKPLGKPVYRDHLPIKIALCLHCEELVYKFNFALNFQYSSSFF